MSEQENKTVYTSDSDTDAKIRELFDLMDEKAAAGELIEVEEDNTEFKKAVEDHFAPMSEAEAAGYEYSMMMKQYDAMLEDWNRREAEEKAAKRAAEKAAKEAAEKGE